MRRIYSIWLLLIIPCNLVIASLAETAAAEPGNSSRIFYGKSGPSPYQACLEKYVKPVRNKNVAKHLENTCVAEFIIKRNDQASLDYYACIRTGLAGLQPNSPAISIVNECRRIKNE